MTALKIAADVEPTPTAEVYLVTPAVAKRWLKRNVRNRPIRDRVVNAYARDMVAGNWRMTGEAIKFDTNGALSDGQHRLTAVVKAGISVHMLVVRGILPESQAVMDSGSKRSQSDALTLNGTANAPLIVSTARLGLRYPELGFVSASDVVKSPTNSEVAAFIEDNPSIHRSTEMGHRFYRSGIDAAPSVISLCYMRLAVIDIWAASEFFASTAEMRTNGPGDPRLALARRLSALRADKVRRDTAVELSLILRAWNKWRKGETAASMPANSTIPTRFA